MKKRRELGSRLTTSRCTWIHINQEPRKKHHGISNAQFKPGAQHQDQIFLAQQAHRSPHTRPCASPSPRAGRSTWPAASSPAGFAAGWTGSAPARQIEPRWGTRMGQWKNCDDGMGVRYHGGGRCWCFRIGKNRGAIRAQGKKCEGFLVSLFFSFPFPNTLKCCWAIWYAT